MTSIDFLGKYGYNQEKRLKAAAEAMRQELKQQKKGNVKSFIAITKKYTDLRELDAMVYGSL